MSIETQQMERRVRDALNDVADSVSPHAQWDRIENDLSRPRPIEGPSSNVAIRTVLAAAVALVLVGGVWLARPALGPVAVGPTSDGPTSSVSGAARAAETAGSSEPLYALPASLDGLVDSGTSRTEIPSGDSGSSVVVGRIQDNGFSDVSVISLLEQASFGDSQRTAEIGGRLVTVVDGGLDDSNPPIAFEVEGVGWVEIAPARPELRESILSSVSIANGAIVFQAVGDLVEIERVDSLEAWRTRILNLRDSESGQPLSIVTRSTSDPDLDPWFGVGDVELTTVRGQPALLTRSAPNETPRRQTLAWNEQPGHAVIVTSSLDADIVEIAEGVRIVGRNAWLAALDAVAVAPTPNTDIGDPLGTVTVRDSAGNLVTIEADGEPTVLLGGTSSCVECSASLDAVNLRVIGSAPRARFIAIQLDPSDSEWGRLGEWVGEVGVLPADAPQPLREALEVYGIVILDGQNRILARISIKAPDALPELDVHLAELGALD